MGPDRVINGTKLLLVQLTARDLQQDRRVARDEWTEHFYPSHEFGSQHLIAGDGEGVKNVPGTVGMVNQTGNAAIHDC